MSDDFSFFDAAANLLAKKEKFESEKFTELSFQEKNSQFQSVRKINDSLGQSVTSSGNRAEIIANEMIKQDIINLAHRNGKEQQKEGEAVFAGKTTSPNLEIAKKYLFDDLKKNLPKNVNVPVAVSDKPLEKNCDLFVKPTKEFIDCITGLGNTFTHASKIAIQFGGHAKTWNAISNAGNSLLTFSTNLSSILTAKTVFTIGAGYWNAATSALTLAVSILNGDSTDDDSDEKWREQVITMMEQVLSALQQGFERIESILIDSVCRRLAHICQKFVRLESIICASFRDLHRKDLLDIADCIKKDMCGEFLQNKLERRNLLRRLSTWIDYHCVSSLEIAQNRIETDSFVIYNEIVTDADNKESIGFFICLLSAIVPCYNAGAKIPNLSLCLYAANLFVLACEKWQIDDRVEFLYERIQLTCTNVANALKSIDENVIECLVRQHAHFCHLIGRALAAANVEFGGTKTMREKIAHLSIGDRDKVFSLLDSMELRRLILVKISTLCSIDAKKRKEIFQLQSKEKFMLGKQNDEANTPNRGVHPHLYWPEAFSLKVMHTPVGAYALARGGYRFDMTLQWFLNNGLNVNSHCGWGTILLHYAQKEKFLASDLHRLLRCPEIQVDAVNAFTHGQWDSRGGSRAVDFMYSQHNFACLLIFVASGHDIGSLPAFDETSKNQQYIACHQFHAAMLNPKSFLYCEKLRQAYNFVKQYESGMGNTLFNGDKKALFTIATLIGLVPHCVNYDFDFDEPLLLCGITWFSLAYVAGNGHVANYLVDHGAKNHQVYWWLDSKKQIGLRVPRVVVPPVQNDETDFQKFLNDEKQRYQQLSQIAKEKPSKNNSEYQLWIDLLKPICDRLNLPLASTILTQIERKIDQKDDSLLSDLNLLNALLKTNANHYVLGPNIDILINQSMKEF